MATLRGPFGEVYDLRPIAELDRIVPYDARELASLLRVLQLLANEPANLDVLHRLVDRHARTRAFEGLPPSHELARRLVQGIADARLFLFLRRPGWKAPPSSSRGLAASALLKDLAATAPALAPPPTATLPAQAQEQVVDWRIGCKHEHDGRQRMIERGTSYQVVPDGKGSDPKKDIVGIWYRNDRDPPPGSLRHAPSGGSDRSAALKGVEGAGYHHYPVEVEYLGDTSRDNFLLPAYWKDFNTRTSYTVRDGPAPITVDVHYPYTWTFTFSLPPLKSYRAGAKLEENIEKKQDGGLTTGKVELEWSRESTGWKKSGLTQTASRSWSEVDSEGGVKHDAHVAQAKPVVGGIKLERSDGHVAQIDMLEMVGQFCWLVGHFNRVVDEILDVAPKIGWYIDLGVQVMQGSLAVAWGWKEYTDHRAYRWVDFRIDLTILSVRLEFGFGVTGLSFAAQLYAAVAGDIKVSADAQRPSPEVEAAITLPVAGNIKGILGVRFQAGYIFRIDAHGETGLVVQLDLRVNDGNRPISLNGETKWTGITVRATVSAGLFGIGGQKTWERELVRPRAIASFNWPKAEPYNPPWISRERMAGVIEGVLTAGLNVRVFKPSGSFLKSDEKWPMDRIVETIVAKLDANKTMRRDQNTIEGMAHAIRKDLDALGARFGRDWITEDKFQAYVDGPGLAKHMAEARDLGRELAQKCGA